jgi:hypothetical protein
MSLLWTGSAAQVFTAVSTIGLSVFLWLVFVPPRRLYSVDNGVPVIKSCFPGLGGVGFYANRYTLCVPFLLIPTSKYRNLY